MKKTNSGFTLVEVLVVVAIISILITMVAPLATGAARGNSLTNTGMQIEQMLNKARQYALTKNRKFEVRFYSYAGSGGRDTDDRVRAMQLFEVSDNGSVSPVSRWKAFPQTVKVNSSSNLSNLIADASRKKSFSGTNDPKIDLPNGTSSYTAYFVRFRPDGSTDLGRSSGSDNGKWYMTLHDAEEDYTSSTTPDNFYTVQIDPVTGTLRTLRP